MYLGENIRYLRTQKGYSQDFIAEQLGYKSFTTIQKWESGVSEPPVKKLKELSLLFDVDMDDMNNKRLSAKEDTIELTSRDNRDIKKDLDSIMERLTNKEYGPAAYDGEELSPEAAELFKDELEIALKRLKLINKEKYNPNKNKE